MPTGQIWFQGAHSIWNTSNYLNFPIGPFSKYSCNTPCCNWSLTCMELKSKKETTKKHSGTSRSQPLCPSFLFSPSLGQGGEPGTGASAYEQSYGRGHGTQADPRTIYRDLCPGHRQHAAQPAAGGCARLPGHGPVCEHLPPGSSSWGGPDTGPGSWQHPTPSSQQLHHALHPMQTQGSQRGPVPTESRQDAHANVLPVSTRRTHPRSFWA